MAPDDLLKIATLEQGLLHISLNRPAQLNALNKELLMYLSKIFNDIKHDASIKALLLTGEGKAFCAGADIKQLIELKGQQGLNFARFGQKVLGELESLGKPSIAAIQGFAFGGGLELAMAATMRIAAEGTTFSQPEIKLGVIPGFGGTQRLSKLIGKGRALDICLTGRRFTVEEALSWGLINEITSTDNLHSRARTLLKSLTSLSPFAMQSILTVINEGYDLPLAAALELEATHFGLCCTTVDKQEGINAFLEKRVPVFGGIE